MYYGTHDIILYAVASDKKDFATSSRLVVEHMSGKESSSNPNEVNKFLLYSILIFHCENSDRAPMIRQFAKPKYPHEPLLFCFVLLIFSCIG